MFFCFQGLRLSGDKAKQDHEPRHDEPSGEGAGSFIDGGKEGAFLGAVHGSESAEIASRQAWTTSRGKHASALVSLERMASKYARLESESSPNSRLKNAVDRSRLKELRAATVPSSRESSR